MKHVAFNSVTEEISILENYTQTEGIFITNILEILEDQVSLGIEKAQMLPDKERNDLLKTLFHMDTLLKIITTKVDDKLFWAIDNVLFEFNKEDGA